MGFLFPFGNAHSYFTPELILVFLFGGDFFGFMNSGNNGAILFADNFLRVLIILRIEFISFGFLKILVDDLFHVVVFFSVVEKDVNFLRVKGRASFAPHHTHFLRFVQRKIDRLGSGRRQFVSGWQKKMTFGI